MEFDKLTAALLIGNQKARSTNIRMKGKNLSMKGRGAMGFNGYLNYDLVLTGAKKYNKNALTKALANEQGEVEIPITIRGPATGPKVRFKGPTARELLADEVKKQLGPDAGILLDGELDLKDAAKSAVMDQAKDAVRKEMDEKSDEVKKELADEAKKTLEKTGIKVPKF